MGGDKNLALADRVQQVADPVVARLGAEVEDVEVSRSGQRSLVRIIVDSDDGVTLDFAADANREVSEALEAAGVMGEQPYVVEVSSPGVTRPLVHERHWRRNIGRLVRVVYRESGKNPVTGRVESVQGETAVLDVQGRSLQVDFAKVKRAVVQVEFNKRAGG
jgi:ribosome maturation factor RimP